MIAFPFGMSDANHIRQPGGCQRGSADSNEGAETITAIVAVLGDPTRALLAAEELGWQGLAIDRPEQLAHTHADLVVVSPALAQVETDAPVLVMDALPETVTELLQAGADEVVGAHTSTDEVAARMLALVRRARLERDRSPLTGLPGNARLEQVARDRLESGDTPALLLLDLDNFKAFNDHYGHWRGDALIRMLAEIAIEAAAPDPGALATHIGGDDFCIVTTPELVDEIGAGCVERFDARVAKHYDEDDTRRGHIATRSRSGEQQQFGIMTLTAVAATAEAADMEHFGQLFQVLAELKTHVKGMAGSNYFKDRRRDHGWS